MNAFYEHHKNSIRFGYRCFDRILLNGLIQPFQQPERVVGFFSTYRNQYPVSRDVLREIADQFHNWVKNRSEKWGAPVLDAPQGRRDEFVEPYFRQAKADQLVVILKALRRLGADNSVFAGHPDTSTQPRHSNRVCWSDAYVGNDFSELLAGPVSTPKGSGSQPSTSGRKAGDD